MYDKTFEIMGISTTVPSTGYIDASKNRGTPKSSILIGFSTINHPFWGTPIFGNTYIAGFLVAINDELPLAAERIPASRRILSIASPRLLNSWLKYLAKKNEGVPRFLLMLQKLGII